MLPLLLRMSVLGAALVGPLLVAQTSRADDAWSRRPFAGEAHTSIAGGPMGLLGVALDAVPSPYFGATVGVGAGLGFSALFAATLRARVPLGPRSALFVGGGLSGGPSYASGSSPLGVAPYRRDYKRTGYAFWADALAGWEVRFSERFGMKLYGGVERLVTTGGSVRCYSQNGSIKDEEEKPVYELPCSSPTPFTEPKGPPRWVPVLGGAFTVAFGG